MKASWSSGLEGNVQELRGSLTVLQTFRYHSQGKCLNKQAQRKRFAVCRKKKSLCAGDIEA